MSFMFHYCNNYNVTSIKLKERIMLIRLTLNIQNSGTNLK